MEGRWPTSDPARAAAPPAASPDARELQFACIAADGRLKALAADNALLLLSSSGEAFAHAPPGARAAAPTRQLSEFALSRAAPLLAQALRLRNTHADRPAFCRALARAAAAAGDIVTLGYRVQSVYWPESAAAALSEGLAEPLDAGRVAVRSRCGAARAVLDGGARARFAVCYPLLLPRHAGGCGADAGCGGYAHAWQTQVFSTRDYPERWAPALAVATAAAAAFDAGAAPQGAAGCGDPGASSSSDPAAAEAAWEGIQGLRMSGAEGPEGGGEWARGEGALGFGARRGAGLGGGGGGGDDSGGGGGDGCGSSAGAGHLYSGLEQGVALAPTQALTWLPEVIWPDYSSSSGGGSSSGTSTSGAPGRREAAGAAGGFGGEGGGGGGGPAADPAAALAECFGSFPAGSWWLDASPLLPADLPVAAVWAPEATYIFLQAEGEVEAWLHEDDSVMTTQGAGFVQHALPGEADPRIYAAGALPDAVVSMATGRRLEVGPVAARALKYRASMAATAQRAAAAAARAPLLRAAAAPAALAGGPARRPPSGGGARALRISSPSHDLGAPEDPPLSDEILEDQQVEGLGSFRAYADGRVRALFEDRTILYMAPDHGGCRLTLPDGKRAAVSVSNPVGVEEYVSAARQFAAWAFRTPQERAALLRAQAAVQAELHTTARMAAICEYGSSSRIPAAAAAAAAEAASAQAAAAEASLGPWASPRSSPGGRPPSSRPLQLPPPWPEDRAADAQSAAGQGGRLAPKRGAGSSAGGSGRLWGVPDQGGGEHGDEGEPWAGATDLAGGGGGGGGGGAAAGAGHSRLVIWPTPGEGRLDAGRGGARAERRRDWEQLHFGVAGGPKEGACDEAGSWGGEGRPLGWSVAAAAADRGRAVEEMLARNAALLQRL